jgi:deoxyribodipyrimidine photolyase-related protein
MTRLLLVLGDQLFPDHSLLQPNDNSLFFMAEDHGLCTHFKYHKQKLVLFLSSMRSHADGLGDKHKLAYHELSEDTKELSYEDKLLKTLEENKDIDTLVCYRIEDVFFRDRVKAFCEKHKLTLEEVESPGFIFPLSDFEDYLKDTKKPFMHNYYKRQRKAKSILMQTDSEPLKGQWSFDEENRKKLPKKVSIPDQPNSERKEHDEAVIALVEALFSDHPGTTEGFNYATTRRAALYRLSAFLKERFEDFGPYEDAFEADQVHLFHSVLSPYINMGLITASEVLEQAVDYAHENDTHYPSLEGFVRQLMGWREFMRGMYHNFDLDKNYFNHQRRMKACWYTGDTGIPPLDDAIRKAQKHGYTHHIERLMVLGNIMLTTGLHPQEVYKWFMEMYVDSADWVMEPNVFAMSQFAEGGIFATKPYLSGSNYIRKMSHYPKGDWCDVMDGLYWGFIDKHRETFEKNPRMGMMLRILDKMDPTKKERLFKAADNWIEKVSFKN